MHDLHRQLLAEPSGEHHLGHGDVLLPVSHCRDHRLRQGGAQAGRVQVLVKTLDQDWVSSCVYEEEVDS